MKTGRSDRVLMIIAVASFAVTLAFLIVEYIGPESSRRTDPQSLLRLLIYWLSGAVMLSLGMLMWSRLRTLARASAISGIYLMLLGCLGGMSGNHEQMPLQIGACTATLLALCTISAKMKTPEELSSA